MSGEGERPEGNQKVGLRTWLESRAEYFRSALEETRKKETERYKGLISHARGIQDKAVILTVFYPVLRLHQLELLIGEKLGRLLRDNLQPKAPQAKGTEAPSSK